LADNWTGAERVTIDEIIRNRSTCESQLVKISKNRESKEEERKLKLIGNLRFQFKGKSFLFSIVR